MADLEDYSYLDEKIDRIIDNYIECKRDEITDEQIRTIRLINIKKTNFSDEELNYIMNYLNEKEIIVTGEYSVLYSDYENYKHNSLPVSKNDGLVMINLTNEEQVELLKNYKETHDKEVLTKLVFSYTNLVNIISQKYAYKYFLEFEELKNVGYEGLLYALNKFDFRDVKIITYATTYIKGYILGFVKEIYGIKTSVYHEFISSRNEVKYNYIGEDNYNEYEHINEVKELFLEKSKGKDKFKDMRMVNMVYALSLNEVEDRVEASDDVSLYKEVLEPIFQKQMNSYVSAMSDGVLNDNQYFAVKYYYGIDEDKRYTLNELANWKECSYQAIHKDLNSAYEVMLDNWIDYMLEFYDNDNHEYDFTPGGIECDRPKYKSKGNNNK